MKYVGGKTRIAKYLAPEILRTNPNIVVEPFCGALNISIELVKLNKEIQVLASDIDSDLMNMWIAIKNGWEPPTDISRDEYYIIKAQPPSPLRTFVGYGCSFAGKWFGGYAHISGRNYCKESYNFIQKKKQYFSNIIFDSKDYRDIKIENKANTVIYCDPPYINTTKPGKRNNFNHDEFWEWVRKQTIPVYVSEYIAPDFMKEIWQKEVKTDMNIKSGGKATRIEKLFCNR